MPIIYTLEKRFVAAATFEGLGAVSFQRERVQEKCSTLWSVLVFTFLEKRIQHKSCLYDEVNLVFYM